MIAQLVALLFCAACALTGASEPDLSTVIRQLGNAQRGIIVIGKLRSRFLLIVGPFLQPIDKPPIDIKDVYIFDLPPNALSNGKLSLSNGAKMSDKWPEMSQLFGYPLITLWDDKSEYVWCTTVKMFHRDKGKFFDLEAEKIVFGANTYTLEYDAIYLSTDDKTNYYYLVLYKELDEFHMGCGDLMTCHSTPSPIARFFCPASNGYLQMSRKQKKCKRMEWCLKLVAGFIVGKHAYLISNTTVYSFSIVLDPEKSDQLVKVEHIDRKAFFVKKSASAAFVGILIAVLLIGLLTALAIVYYCYRSKWACCRRVSKSLKSHSSHKRRHSSHKLKRHTTGKTRKTRKTHKKHSGQKLKANSLKH